MTWNENSQLCQLLLNEEYRRHYIAFAKLPDNAIGRRNMLRLARQTEKIAKGEMFTEKPWNDPNRQIR